MCRFYLLFVGIHYKMVVEVDGLFVVLHGDAFIVTVETCHVVGIHDGRAEPVHVVGEAQVVAGVRVSYHGAWNKRQ